MIFDIDGVIISEEKYWDCAALTVMEMLGKITEFRKIEDEAPNIRKRVFLDDKTISNARKLGAINNHDLSFYTYCLLMLNGCNYTAACNFFSSEVKSTAELQEYIKKELGDDYSYKGKVWNKVRSVFQSWYNGSKKKDGFINKERSVVEIQRLNSMLETVSSLGVNLGIASGRPWNETVTPLINLGVFKYFNINLISTQLDVEGVEKLFGKSVAKPHPYPFLKAVLGKNFDDDKILSGDYSINTEEILAAGASVENILSARASGMKFAAVLTGIDGEAARADFYEAGADFIFSNILELSELFA